MTTSFSRTQDAGQSVVAIDSIDLNSGTCTGFSPMTGQIVIRLTVMSAGIYNIPKIGEQWVVGRFANQWYLDYKVAFQDARLNLPMEEGMTVIGRDGPTQLVGSRVQMPQMIRMGNFDVRLSPAGVIQVKSAAKTDDPGNWVSVGGSAPVTVPTTGTAPHKVVLMQTGPDVKRAAGYGQVWTGIRPGPCTFQRIVLEFPSADATGSTTVKVYNGTTVLTTLTVTAANQATTLATRPSRTATGSWAFAEDDILSAEITTLGGTPGNGLIAYLTGTVSVTLS
jgi:hypothetical protein